MSWSISIWGKKEAMQKALEQELVHKVCQEPEETIRKNVMCIALASVKEMPPGTVAKVEGHGSMVFGSDKSAGTNSVAIKVEPMHGFRE